MASSVKKTKCNSKSCQSASTQVAKQIHQNGKGDKSRISSKKQYDKNYDSINWKRK